ncbi:hypothetical protein CHIBA101_1666 [Actinomyces sp. Chiba101]|nr:hypothetical protein CHIBA101_1666 [Actinomyces sp. Chiba101]GAV93649.1 hypothetical protein ADENT20671_0400 [Actinomyces denticolens]
MASSMASGPSWAGVGMEETGPSSRPSAPTSAAAILVPPRSSPTTTGAPAPPVVLGAWEATVAPPASVEAMGFLSLPAGRRSEDAMGVRKWGRSGPGAASGPDRAGLR